MWIDTNMSTTDLKSPTEFTIKIAVHIGLHILLIKDVYYST